MSTILRRGVFELIQDERARESIQWIYEYLIGQELLKPNFQFLEVTVTTAVTALSVPHGLGFRPLDIIQTSATNGATVTFQFDQFTSTNIVLTTDAATTVRFFGGSYAI